MSNDLFWENLYQNDEEKSQKEFILSYYYTFLQATGPLDVRILEETWQIQKELFSDVSFYVTHGISNFLLNSNKFQFINGKIQTTDNNNANENRETALNKTNDSKNLSLTKMCEIIKIEQPTINQIITYNIERNKSLIESANNDDENDKIKSLSLELKINSIITFSNVQAQNEMQVCVRPAVEYSMYSLHESLRPNGSYTFKFTVHLSDNELDILSCLLRKHLLLLDYRNDDTFEYFISIEKCVPETGDDDLNHFDSYLINNDNNGIFQFNSVNPSNIYSSKDEYFISEIKRKYVTAVQKFLFECEIQKKKIGDQNHEVWKMALQNEMPNNKLQHQCINYLAFLRNLMEKQIKSFQDKALQFLSFFKEIKSNNISNSNSNFGNKNSIHTWKLCLYETKEEFKKMLVVFEKFKFLILSDKTLNLKTFDFVTMKEEPPDNLHSQLKKIINNNFFIKLRDVNSSTHLQILQEYIYGPYLGILYKPKQVDDTPVHNFNQAFSSGLIPKLYFVKQSHNLNIPNKKSNKIDRMKTNIREADALTDISTFLIKNLKVPNKRVSVPGIEINHELKLRMSISKLNKYVFGTNSFNRFEIVVNSDCRNKLLTLNMTELSEILSEYIPLYLLRGRIFMSKEKLPYLDMFSLPINIYFGLQSKNGFFEPFINIKCNFNRMDDLPHNIEVEIKKNSSEMVHTMDNFLRNGSICDESVCGQFTNLQINAPGYPFLNEQSESEVSRCDSPKSILERSTGAKPKQPIYSKIKKQKHVTIIENLETCCICRNTFRRIPKFHLKCQHFFHKECIQIWNEKNHLCPVCRQIIEYEEFPPL